MLDRIALLEHCNSTYPNGLVVEIGVASGCFTKQILASYPSLKKLVIIDSWKFQQEGYNDPCNLSQETQDERYEQIKKDFSGEKKVVIVRAWSNEAVGRFFNSSISVLYLDANHSYEACKADLELWYPKIKKGGIFAGHDYCNGDGVGHGVKKAVDEFAALHGLEVGSTKNEYCGPEGIYGVSWEGFSFYFIKP